jgi:hypothetical protein
MTVVRLERLLVYLVCAPSIRVLLGRTQQLGDLTGKVHPLIGMELWIDQDRCDHVHGCSSWRPCS